MRRCGHMFLAVYRNLSLVSVGYQNCGFPSICLNVECWVECKMHNADSKKQTTRKKCAYTEICSFVFLFSSTLNN